MTAPAVSSAPPSAFAGADIAAVAGLRWDPAFPTPRFEAVTWRLDGWADAPAQMTAKEKRLEFGKIRNSLWRTVAKELTVAWLAPHHERVIALPGVPRAPRHPRTCHSRLFHLTAWLNWLTDRGVPALGAVTQHECDAFLGDYAEVLDENGQVIRRKSPGGLAHATGVMKDIGRYGALLSADRYQPGFDPWPGRSPGMAAGAPPRPGNTTPPLPDEVLRPLLAAVLYLTETLGPHVLRLRESLREHRQRAGQMSERLPPGGLRPAMEELLARDFAGPGVPLPQLPEVTVARLLNRRERDEQDPLLRVSLSALGHRLGVRRIPGEHLGGLRDLLEAAVAAVGTAPEWGRDAAPVGRADDSSTLVPWTLPLAADRVDSLAEIVHTAAMVTVAAFTGMRASELMELAPGCRQPPDEAGDGLLRYRLAGKVIKGRQRGGERDEWVVIEPAWRAAGIAEQLTAPDGARFLFSRFAATSFRAGPYATLRNWVNSPAGERLGLDPVPGYPVTLRALRRTLSLELAARPGGVLAAKVALKHISVVTTEGYAARPGGAQAVFHAEWKAEEARENLRLTVEAFRQFQNGQMPAGPGADRLTEAFRGVERELAGHEPGPVRVTGTDRQAELLLKAKAATLHQAAANYCWFDDPGQALCLKLAGTGSAPAPLAGMCDSARCPQATHHPRHRAVWVSIAQTTSAMLASPRIPAGEKQRLRRDHDRSQAVIQAIDDAQPATREEG